MSYAVQGRSVPFHVSGDGKDNFFKIANFFGRGELSLGGRVVFRQHEPGGANLSFNSVPRVAGRSWLALQGDLIAVNQTWQNMAASRLPNTTYQNTTDRPIQVFVRVNGRNNHCDFEVSPDNVTFEQITFTVRDNGDGKFQGSITAIVPAGHYYGISGTNFDTWNELR